MPVRPLPSMRLQINAGGLALGLLLGLGIAAFLEIRDATFRTDADVFEVLALPVLASVPYRRRRPTTGRGRDGVG